jgi:uncharacterized lipoprotein YmbA
VTGCRVSRPAIAIALMICAVSACSTSSPSRFYTLEPVAAAGSGDSMASPILVGPVTVPDEVDRPEFVVRTGPNRVGIDEFNRWASPLTDGIAQTVVADLGKLLNDPNVAAAPLANFKPAYRVVIDIQRFESTAGKSASLEAVWTVRRMADGFTRVGRTIASEPVSSSTFAELAAAHSRGIAKLSGDIAAAVRAEAESGD